MHPILALLALTLIVMALVYPTDPAAAAQPGMAMATPIDPPPARSLPPPFSPGLLERRLASWPAWSLPAPLPRPDRDDLIWPAWFRGEWEVSSTTADGAEPPLRWRARFVPNGNGGAVANRAFNASQIGKALLGDELISVRNDPANPNRQVSLLRGDRQLFEVAAKLAGLAGGQHLPHRFTHRCHQAGGQGGHDPAQGIRSGFGQQGGAQHRIGGGRLQQGLTGPGGQGGVGPVL